MVVVQALDVVLVEARPVCISMMTSGSVPPFAIRCGVPEATSTAEPAATTSSDPFSITVP
jgi:hypothetical protein